MRSWGMCGLMLLCAAHARLHSAAKQGAVQHALQALVTKDRAFEGEILTWSQATQEPGASASDLRAKVDSAKYGDGSCSEKNVAESCFAAEECAQGRLPWPDPTTPNPTFVARSNDA